MVKEINVTDKLDVDQPATDVAQAAVDKKPQTKTDKKPVSVLSVLTLLLALLALIAIAGLSWKGFEFIQQLSSLELKLQQSEQGKASVNQELNKLQQQLVAQSQLQQHTSQRLAELPGADTDDWLIAESEYLLRLANQRLNLEKDLQGALAILMAADSILAETKNPQLDHIRSVLAREIVTLRAVPAVDVTGAVSRIQAVQEQVIQLEWMPRTLPKAVVKEETIEDKIELTAWQKFLVKAENGLSSMVRIQHHDTALPAPLTPDQYYYLQQNMQLMLEQAQVALVRQQADLYLHSIQRTQAWLNEFVRSETAQAQALQQTLVELAKWEVAPALPDISGSLNELRRYSGVQKKQPANSAAK